MHYFVMSLLLDLLMPAKCLFCDRLPKRVCEICSANIGNDPRLVFRSGLVGFASMGYTASAKSLLRSFKELGESVLAPVLASAMAPLVSCFQESPKVLVPIPSNASSMRERGYNPAELLARELCRNLPGVRWVNALTRVRETLDQSKLTPNARIENQTGSMDARSGTARVLLIDDVVTTGATLLAATRELQKAGYFVEGFLTFAETERKGCTLTTQASLPADGGTSWN